MPDFNGDHCLGGRDRQFYVMLTAGVQYFFELEGEATVGTLRDPLMVVTLGATEVATDDDGGLGPNSRAVFTAPTTGIYTFSVSGFERLHRRLPASRQS